MPAEILDRLSQAAQSVITSLRVRSSLNPSLWMGAVFGLICFGFALAFLHMGERAVMWVLIGAGVFSMAVGWFTGILFAVSAQDRLGSEEYQVRSHALRIIGEKGKRFSVDPASLQEIASPPPPKMLPDKPEDR